MGSTSSRDHRCSFDAAGSNLWRGFWATCAVCGRTGAWAKMLECEHEACRHGYAHRQCVEGALRSDHRDSGHRTTRFNHVFPATADSIAQTVDGPSAVEVTCVDGWAQTSVHTDDITCGDEITFADVTSPTDVVTRHVVSGCEIVHVDSSSQTDVAACQVALGAEGNSAEESPVTDQVPVNDYAQAEYVQESTLCPTHEYWEQRFALFSKFDAGIMLDEVSLRSTCSEVSAKHLANRCWYETVLNPFCGAGGNAIQLAFTCQHVIAMDANPKKIALAKWNAEVYGVADRIDFRVGDFFLMAGDLRTDVVIASPPRSGRVHARRPEYDAGDLSTHEPGSFATVVRTACVVAPKVVLHLTAKNIDECPQMAMDERFSHIQYESVMVDGKPICRNIYLTRNDTNVKGPPMKFSGAVHLKTPSSLGEQTLKRADNIVA